VQITVA